MKFLKDINENQEPQPLDQDVDFDDNDLDDNVIGTVPADRVKKGYVYHSNYDDDNDSDEDDDDDQQPLVLADKSGPSSIDPVIESTAYNKKKSVVIGLLITALILASGSIYLINEPSVNIQPVNDLKVVLHKQNFKASVPEHVVKLTYLDSKNDPAYIAFYGNGIWALSSKDTFGNNLKSISDRDAVEVTGKAIANQAQQKTKSRTTLSFAQLAKMPGIKTTMRYQFSNDSSRVELGIRVSPTKDFKRFFPNDTIRQLTTYNYVFANFKNTAKNKFDADMSTSFNGEIAKTSRSVVLEIIR